MKESKGRFSPNRQENYMSPFPWQKLKIVDEESVITDIATFLYPEQMGRGNPQRKAARERVRSAINIHRRRGTLQAPVSQSPKTLRVQDFLDFACGRWPALQSVIDSHNVTAQLFPMEALSGEVGEIEVSISNPPKDYDDLLTEYRRILEAWRDDRRLLEDAQQKLTKLEQTRRQNKEYGAKRYK